MAWAMAIPAAASAIGGMASEADQVAAAKLARENAQRVAQGLPPLDLPQGNYGTIGYEGDYNPYMIGTPESANYQVSQENPETRGIEMKALQSLVDQANGSADAKMQSDQFHAMDNAAQMAQAREGAIRQQMERKGQGGVGLSALQRAQAAQMGANRAQGGELDAVSQAALAKLAAQSQAIQGAGAVRGQDMTQLARADDIVNRFNMFNTQARNAAHQQDIANQNAAALRNVNTRQELRGRNVGINNSNLDRLTSNAKAKYGALQDKAKMMINGENGVATGDMQTGAAYNQMGQQGAQLFTNIGKGIASEQALGPKDDESGSYTSDDGSFTSRWW